VVPPSKPQPKSAPDDDQLMTIVDPVHRSWWAALEVTSIRLRFQFRYGSTPAAAYAREAKTLVMPEVAERVEQVVPLAKLLSVSFQAMPE